MFEGHLSTEEEDRNVQMEEVRTFAQYCDPFAKVVGEGETDWGYGGMLTAIGGTNYPHGRGSHTLTWAGATVSSLLPLGESLVADPFSLTSPRAPIGLSTRRRTLRSCCSSTRSHS